MRCNTEQARQGRDGGYVLQLALITFLALVIGAVAFASRTSSGLFGAFSQGVNREARDTAESAIAEFANTMNRERNRHILIAGNATSAAWDSATNPCTQYDSAGVQTSTTSLSVVTADRDRFLPGGTAKNLVAGNTDRRFVVESIEYLDQNRNTFATAIASNPNFLSDIRNGGNRTLIRITVRGESTRNGRTSTARVAREFEVVPKCCKRSFGSNGAVNWGRDREACTITQNPGGGRGIIGSLNGTPNGWPNSSRNTKDIRDENGDIITQGICWAGNGTPSTPSDLTGTPSSGCTGGTLTIGNSGTSTSNTGISLAPQEFRLVLPTYNNPNPGTVGFAALNLGNNNNRYVYFDTVDNRVNLCQLSGSSVSNCQRLDGQLHTATSPTNPDPCYVVNAANPTASPPVPYAQVNCRMRSISLGNNTTMSIDTTAAKINLFFDDNTYTGVYMDQGNGQYQRVDCRQASSLGSAPATNYSGGSNRCTRELPWRLLPGDTQLAFTSKCTAGATTCPAYDASELLNVFATGTGSFNLNGTTASIGMNFYAPKASIRVNGGGNRRGCDPVDPRYPNDPCPNIMGRIWADGIDLDGAITVKTLASLPSFCTTASCPPGGIPFFDFMARSFTHSSGF
ncbi:hypothetical protein [Cyanobium sp. NIES-981]|uniref:hypothetical protein n=1 Tax=Cyanobium sp. NIES-981 TaxID=1851505 RepID=UPI00155FC613|nr:hypothetical protein [Cyanobium sp. NIES-981]